MSPSSQTPSFRRSRVVVPTVALALLAWASAVAPADAGLQSPSVTTERLGGSVSVLYGSGGNLAVSSGEDGVLVVDSQFARMAAAIRGELDGLVGGEGTEPVFLVNTHFHSDHVGGNVELGRGSRIVAHRNVRRRMEAGDGPGGQRIEPSPPAALPIVTFEDELSLWFNGEEVRIRHLPAGHTDGDALVWFTGSNVVHLGDTFFNERFPYVDVPSGGSIRGLVDGLGELLAELPDDVAIIPGHGPAGGKAELAGYVEMLRESAARVRAALADGRTLADMQAVRLLDDYSDWGDGNGFLPVVVQSVMAE